jgi:hypothetical protein
LNHVFLIISASLSPAQIFFEQLSSLNKNIVASLNAKTKTRYRSDSWFLLLGSLFFVSLSTMLKKYLSRPSEMLKKRNQAKKPSKQKTPLSRCFCKLFD